MALLSREQQGHRPRDALYRAPISCRIRICRAGAAPSFDHGMPDYATMSGACHAGGDDSIYLESSDLRNSREYHYARSARAGISSGWRAFSRRAIGPDGYSSDIIRLLRRFFPVRGVAVRGPADRHRHMPAAACARLPVTT